MTTTKLLAAAVALPLLAPAATNAALMSAQDLFTACAGNGVARATCDGYLMAATDVVLRRQGRGQAGGQTRARLCVPATVTIDQVRDAVLDVGHRGRGMRAPAGLGLVAAAMRHTWPCEGSAGDAPAFGDPGANQRPWRRRDSGLPDEPGAPRDQ